MNIQFRESQPSGYVRVLVDGREVFASSEYRLAAEWAKRRYQLTDDRLMALYRDYKDDYDAEGQ